MIGTREHYMATPNSHAKLGQGGRFAALVKKIRSRGGKAARNPGAIAAAIGRKKYGNARFQAMAAKGRKSA